jgi:hypothetical protein
MFNPWKVTVLSVLAASVCLATPAVSFACSGSGFEYTQPKSDKPVIEYRKLDAEQKAQIEAYASGLWAKQQELQNKARAKDIPWDEARSQFAEYVKTAGADLQFRALVETSDGMLCGSGHILVAVPPIPGTYEMRGLDATIRGKYERSGKAGDGLLMYMFATSATFDKLAK